LGRAEFVRTQGFLWVEDPEVREMLRTRRQTADLFVDPSPPAGLLIVPGVDVDRLARRCRALGVEILIDGEVYKTRSMLPPGRSNGHVRAAGGRSRTPASSQSIKAVRSRSATPPSSQAIKAVRGRSLTPPSSRSSQKIEAVSPRSRSSSRPAAPIEAKPDSSPLTRPSSGTRAKSRRSSVPSSRRGGGSSQR
jgi:hypothetical protein